MQVHKVTLMIIDYDGLGPAGVRGVLENTKFATQESEFKRLFEEK